MDSTARVEPVEMIEASDGGEGDGDLGARMSKRAKIGPGPGPELVNGNGPGRELKRVAEIVLVLSAMARMRGGGKGPTEAEVELMVEARAKLAEACAALAPKDVVGREAIGAVIEDLGLNGKLKDQRLGFRTPKLTIKEKFDNAKRKMDESKNFVAHTAYTSHPVQPSSSPSAEIGGALHTVRTFPSDKLGNLPISSGGVPGSSPLGHPSAATSTSVQYQLPTNEVRPGMVSRGLPTGHLGRDSSSLSLPKVERVQFKLDGGSNGSSYASQLQANSSANHPLVNAPAWSVQTQSASTAKGGQENKVPNHCSAKVEGAADVSMSRVSTQGARDQSFRPFVTQTASGNLSNIQQPLQGMGFVQAPSLGNNHNELAKLVQKLLQPQRPDHPQWTPPSRDYMNKALTCQLCQLTIGEVDNVLLCDACEKGYHLKCLQPNQKGIPRGEWHCMRCLSLTQGKPLPPKYGRVMRSTTNQPNVTPDIAMKASSSEKKVGTLDPMVNKQKMTANGSPALQSPTNASSAGTNHVESASDVKTPNARETQGNNSISSSKIIDDKAFSGASPDIPSKPLEATSCSAPVGSSSVKSAESIKDCELSTREERTFEQKTESPAKVSETVSSKSNPSQPSHNLQVVDWRDLPNSDEVPSKNCHDNDLAVKDLEKSQTRENLDCTSGSDTKQDDQSVAWENLSGGFQTCSGTERSGFPSDGLHSVEWIGNIIQVLDGKSFYQSCRVNGVMYKLQNHALFPSNHGELLPSKLQSMWEDSKTGSKWVIVTRCYFPGDLPENVGRPCAPESNEVYESNHESTIMAGLIQGPCEVLPPAKFSEENERRSQAGPQAGIGLQPVFLCKWFYDEFKGIFQPVSS